MLRLVSMAGFVLALVACDPSTPTGNTSEPEPLPATCEESDAAIASELASIQSCSTDDECGLVLTGTSCGCTRDLVARTGVDTTHFDDLMDHSADLGCDGFLSTCDCPPADGFVCNDGTCQWNYTR